MSKPAVRGPTRRIRLASLTWMDDSACTWDDQGLFFAPDGEREPERLIREGQAAEICAVCPVWDACDAWAVRERETGMWAGRNETERKVALRRSRRQAASSGAAAPPADTHDLDDEREAS